MKAPNLAEQIACGASGLRAIDIAACDGRKIFGFDAGNIVDMSCRAAHFPSAEAMFGQVVAQTGFEEQVGAETLGVHPHGPHEHRRWDIDVPHPPAQRLTHRCGDVGSGQQRRSGRTVCPTVVTVWVQQGADRNSRNVFVGGRRIPARSRGRRQHPELCGDGDQLQIVVGEVAGIHCDVGSIGQQLEQLVRQPGMPGHQGRMFRAGQPLPQRYDGLQTGPPRRHGKRHRAVECVRVVRGIEEQPVDPIQRGLNLLDVKHVGDDNFSADRP